MEKIIGEKLKKVLLANDMTAARLSKLIDLPEPQISLTMSGKRLPSTNMIVGMDVLGLIDANEYLYEIMDYKIECAKQKMMEAKNIKINTLLKIANESEGKEKADALFELKYLI